jgi:hypothetical protein
MSVAVLTPYASLNPESGLLHLLARRLKSRGDHVEQVRCNGIFSTCDRDALTGWRRTVGSCAGCIADQRSLAAWAGIPATELSIFLSPSDIERIEQLVATLDIAELWSLEFDGVNFENTLQASFAERFPGVRFDPSNRQHEQAVARLARSALRCAVAVSKYFAGRRPGVLMTAAGEGFLEQIVSHQALKAGIACAVLHSEPSRRCTTMRWLGDSTLHEIPLLIASLDGMRSDPATWSPELMTIVDQCLEGPRMAAALAARNSEDERPEAVSVRGADTALNVA